ALLTGASGGIGGALGRRLIAVGVRVAFTYHAHPDEANQLLAVATNAGLEALALAADLADPDLPALLVERTTAVLGPIDLLIANAGYAVRQENVGAKKPFDPRLFTLEDQKAFSRLRPMWRSVCASRFK